MSSTSDFTATDADDECGSTNDNSTTVTANRSTSTSTAFVGLTVEARVRSRRCRGSTISPTNSSTDAPYVDKSSLASVFQRVSSEFAAASLSKQCLTTVTMAQMSAVCAASVINALCVLVAFQLQVEVRLTLFVALDVSFGMALD